MNTLIEYRLAALRKLMRSKGWDAAIVPGSDPHGSEYLPERWKQREFISGFTGDYGTIVVTPSHAGLWTDTRFFIQFDKELGDTEFVLHKLRVPDAVNYPEWMAGALPEGAVVGIDGSCMNVAEVEYLQKALAPLHARIVSQPDYLNELWKERPGTPTDPVFVLDTQYTGRTAEHKIAWLRGILAGKGCNGILLNNLDEIAWLLNLRSNDVAFNPVFISYLLVGNDAVVLFANPDKFVPQVLPEGVRILPYGDVFDFVGKLPSTCRLLIDDSVMNYALCSIARERLGENVVHARSPIQLEKALKNETELAGYRKAYLKDGIAQTKYFKWLEEMLQSGAQISEMEAADKLVEFRREQGNYIEESFAPISATGENAALPHYQPTHENCSIIQARGLYLLDSGAHYLEGTTDITRTIPAGPLTALEKEDYTLVLKGMIGLSTAIFPVERAEQTSTYWHASLCGRHCATSDTAQDTAWAMCSVYTKVHRICDRTSMTRPCCQGWSPATSPDFTAKGCTAYATRTSSSAMRWRRMSLATGWDLRHLPAHTLTPHHSFPSC